MVLTVPQRQPPSYSAGYARCQDESAYPQLWDGLVGAWHPGLGPTGDTLYDHSGNQNHGTLTNMEPGTDWITGPSGWELDFGGTDEYVTVPDFVTPTTNCTVVLEGYFSNLQASAFGNSTDLTNRFQAHTPFSNTIYWDFSGATAGVSRVSWNAGAAYWNARHSISLTAGSHGMEIFSDGVLKASHATSVTRSATTGLHIGRYSGSYLTGSLSSLLIYKRVLSHDEILLLKRAPLAPFERRRVFPVSTQAAATTATPALVKIPSTVRPSYQQGYARSAAESAYPELWDGLVAAYPLLGPARVSAANWDMTLRDVTEYGQDLKCAQIGTPDSVVSPHGFAHNFNGTTDSFSTRNSDDGRSNPPAHMQLAKVSVSAYVTCNATGTDDIIAGQTDGVSEGWRLWQDGSNIKFGIQAYNTNNATSSTIADGNWHHVVGSYDGATCRIYVDGVEGSSASDSGPITYASIDNFRIGTSIGWTVWDGNIGNVCVWNRALTQDEVLTLNRDTLAPFHRKRFFPVSTQAAVASSIIPRIMHHRRLLGCS